MGVDDRKCSDESDYCTLRGGNYNNKYKDASAGYRSNGSDGVGAGTGFRLTLFL